MLVHNKSTRRHTPEDYIFQSHRKENLKSYTDNSCNVAVNQEGAFFVLKRDLPTVGDKGPLIYVISARIWLRMTKPQYSITPINMNAL
jgi:hypothetical protein